MSGTLVKDVMTPNIVHVFEDQDVEEAARLMKEKQIRRLVALNRDKRLVGRAALQCRPTSFSSAPRRSRQWIRTWCG
jgi:CBS-domain-containing membrane protein